ncbi:hypothetical protein SUT007_02630 [Streptococcus parasuis]|nr:hypothetical protein SUT007_02630 [Streptococcus parasuis]
MEVEELEVLLVVDTSLDDELDAIELELFADEPTFKSVLNCSKELEWQALSKNKLASVSPSDINFFICFTHNTETIECYH